MPKKKFNKTPGQALRLWINALRSGKYKQGKSKLKQRDVVHPEECLYCCLGVAKELYEKYENKGKSLGRSGNLVLSGKNKVVCDWLGLNSPGGLFKKSPNFDTYKKLPEYQGYCCVDLAQANDSGVSFKVIAGFIEKYWVQKR